MELPFAVESPERTSQILPSASSTTSAAADNDIIADDDGSSLVTTSSQGSFLGSSSGTGGDGAFHSHPTTLLSSPLNATTTTATPPVAAMSPNAPNHFSSIHSNTTSNTGTSTVHQQHQQQHTSGFVQATNSTHLNNNNNINNRGPAPIVAPLPPAPVPAPAARSGGGGLASGLNFLGSLRVPGMPSVLTSSRKAKAPSSYASQTTPQQQQKPSSTETVDFTYVNVCETDADEVDITLDGQHTAMQSLQGRLGGDDDENSPPGELMRGDILSILLSGAAQQEDSTNETLVRQCEEANQAANRALEAKKDGELQGALDAHAQAAKQFREAAVLLKDRNASMANSLLLLSQTQAKSALALKRIVGQQPTPHDSKNASDSKNSRPKVLTQKDRLRMAVRGALVTRNEEEMSDSAFLGRATKGPMTSTGISPVMDSTSAKATTSAQSSSSGNSNSNASSAADGGTPHNPVDDMMELERELRDMDMALEMGNSIASLDARTQNRLKNSSGIDGSFMVVPPGSQSYMSSSNMWAPSSGSSSANTSSRVNHKQNQNRTTAAAGTAGVRARANRVQNKLGASSHNPRASSHAHVVQHQQATPHGQQQHTRNTAAAAPAQQGLDASWWGTSSTTSQMLASSVISLGASSITTRGGMGGEGMGGTADANSTANTKQIMRLMDALKTLSEENANLMQEVEEAEAARMEAKATKEQMARFKADYGKRFAHLKAALQKFRENHPENGSGAAAGNRESNPVTNSEFMRSASTSEQLQRQEQLIRKLTADLKKEKEESKKKDQALRKYESFYREVKARSAQKAAQRQREAGAPSQRPPQPHSRRPGQR